MIYWGISANSHNASLAVFQNDSIVFASETERFSGIKNDPHLNEAILSHATDQFGKPDRVVWYEKPLLKTLRQLIAGQGWLYRENNIRSYLKKYGIDSSVSFVKHHHSHAAAGYFTSKFDEACILIIDAIGEFETISIWQASGRSMRKLSSESYPNSLGLWYSAMTDRIGLKANEEEYILMGMSAFGDADRLYNELLEDFISIDKNKPNHFSFKHNLHTGCKWWRPELMSDKDRFDIAAATQKLYETLFEKLLRRAVIAVPSKNLVLMGGCALNCVANNLAYKYFDAVWIMPAPGDSGSAIGSVLAKKSSHVEWSGPYLGYDLGYKTEDQDIVEYLINHRVCGLARGAAELGPRALGNRSLIADPRGNDIKDKVNDIKHRELFRPFAPAILAEHAHEYFNIPWGRSSDYMQMVYRCKYPELFPAIVHVDGTSRLQTVAKGSGRFRTLLEIWYERTGCPMILNTSLNIKGQPMINDEHHVQQWSRKYSLPVFT